MDVIFLYYWIHRVYLVFNFILFCDTMLLFLTLYITSLGQFIRAMLVLWLLILPSCFPKEYQKKGHLIGIQVCFFCHNLSSSGFNSLYSFLNSQQKEILFKNLHWVITNLERCFTHFYTVFLIHSRIYI